MTEQCVPSNWVSMQVHQDSIILEAICETAIRQKISNIGENEKDQNQ